jgi:hypothetical protein
MLLLLYLHFFVSLLSSYALSADAQGGVCVWDISEASEVNSLKVRRTFFFAGLTSVLLMRVLLLTIIMKRRG